MASVLLIDDEALWRKSMERVLKRLGYEVVLAATEDEGVALFSSAEPDIVVADWNLVEGDGLTALRRIRAMDADARVVLTSASTPPAEAGDLPFITKPWGREGFQVLALLLDG